MKSVAWHILLLLCTVWFVGCTVHGGHGDASHPADDLNRKAQAWHYRDLDSAVHYALRAYEVSAHYSHGRIVACNTLGFVATMRMHYDEALQWYSEVYKRAGCELERLVADVGQMEVYQRTADNLAFYDCRVRADKRLQHINEEVAGFIPTEQKRLQSTVTRMHMVTAQYYFMMGQRLEANAEMHRVEVDEAFSADTVQWLMYQYLRGIGIDEKESTREQRLVLRYSHLNNCLRTARAGKFQYFEGMASVGLSQLLADSARADYIAHSRPNSFAQLNDSAQTTMVLCKKLAEEASQHFVDYGDTYGELLAIVQIASLYNRIGKYEEALEPLALGERWRGAPDALSRMYEEASLAFSGLGDKESSDYYRNQYLDLLETTRQNREVESRYFSLERQHRMMQWLLYATMAGALLLVMLIVMLTKRRKRGGGRYEQQLNELAEEAEKRVYLHRRHIERGKRYNIVRKASFSVVTGIMPYIDRMAHEVEKLKSPEVWNNRQLRQRRIEYISELTDEINNLNDFLAQWVKTKQGVVGLHIESFALDEVFAMIARGSASFALKGLAFEVQPTSSVVKADMALTFFMINTLADNARKYTPEGGRVSITAQVDDEYVEVSVADTGVGMTIDEINCILKEKVYDASAIGLYLPPEQRKNKGSGFGLLNCKGIIEKYRKTDSLFDVCRFGIESRVGEGSRIWFRLPKGVHRALTLLGVVVLPYIAFAHEDQGYDVLLEQASSFADSVYYANVEGRYEEALRYADSSIAYLNAHHRIFAEEYIGEMTAMMGESDVETRWWFSDYATDYHTILDVRNELAVANLALRQWNNYRYNNRIYNDLYKLVSEDRTLIEYCDRMQRYNNNIMVAAIACVLLLLGYLVVILYAFMGRVENAYRNIEIMEEDERRARHEENRLHVQNMVLDNCLSTIKHETVYYPNRIKQLVGKLEQNDEREQIKELVDYYQLVFSILVACASRQLEEVSFRHTTIEVDNLLEEASRYHAKLRKSNSSVPVLTMEKGNIYLQCDPQLITFLLEQLIDVSFALSATDRLHLSATLDGDFVRITLANKSRILAPEQLHTMFYPSQSEVIVPEGKPYGIEYIVCRQIIREHDAHFNHMGCRIKAESIADGYSVWFTLPLAPNSIIHKS